MTEMHVSEVIAWAIPEIPGMWLQVLGYDDNLAASPEQEECFASGYVECLVHYQNKVVSGIFIAQRASKERIQPTSDTHHFLLLAHNETLEDIGVILIGRMLQFWAQYRNLDTDAHHVCGVTLSTTWEG